MIAGKNVSDVMVFGFGSRTDVDLSKLDSSGSVAGKRQGSLSGSERSIIRFKKEEMVLVLLGEIKDFLAEYEQCLQEAFSSREQPGEPPHQDEDSSLELVSLRSSVQSRMPSWALDSIEREFPRHCLVFCIRQQHSLMGCCFLPSRSLPSV